MANVHILTIEGGKMRLACHVAVPGTNNQAGVAWSTALVNAKRTTPSVMTSGDGTLGTIASTEVSALAAGTLYERVVSYDLGPDWNGLTAQNKGARIDQVFADVQNVVQAELQAALNYFGFTR